MNPTLESSIISAGVALLVVLIGQVLVAIIRERHALSRDARYLATRVVCVLDKYSRRLCLDSDCFWSRWRKRKFDCSSECITWQAHELTVELRKKYGIQEIQNRAWDPVQHLKDELKEIEDRHKKNAAVWEEILPTLPPVPTTDSAK
jgi:hypothetical protein